MNNQIIYKYPLPTLGEQIVEMPEYSTILTVGEQDDCLFVWAIINEAEQKKRQLRFLVVYTGSKFTYHPAIQYLTTVQKKNGIVAHIFIDYTVYFKIQKQ